MAGDKFDLSKVQQNFEEAIADDDDVVVEFYLKAYQELYKFFTAMGTVFGFVSSDIKAKVEILEELRCKDTEKYSTVKTMIIHEHNNELIDKRDFVSGSRTLLRLHRGLDFLRDFLRRLADLQENEKCCSACQVSYGETLAAYHPWIIRKGATMAMHALPTKQNLLKKVCVDVEKAVLILPDMLVATDRIYDRVHQLYTVYNLHELA